MVELVARYSKTAQPEIQAVERALAAGGQLRATPEVSNPESAPAPEPVIHRAKDRLSELELALVVSRYQAGESAAMLGEELGIAKQTVMRLLKAEGVALHRPRLSGSEKAEAIRLYLDGWSLAKIGSKLARDHSSVRNVLLREGIERRDEHGRPRTGQG